MATDHAPSHWNSLKHNEFGLPNEQRATTNSHHRVTLVTSGVTKLVGGNAHIFQVPVPDKMPRPDMTQRVRIEVTLSYTARPGRIRGYLSRYLSTWLTWDVSKSGESYESFRDRMLKFGDDTDADGDQVLPWTLKEQEQWGLLRGAHRHRFTLQKAGVLFKPINCLRAFAWR